MISLDMEGAAVSDLLRGWAGVLRNGNEIPFEDNWKLREVLMEGAAEIERLKQIISEVK